MGDSYNADREDFVMNFVHDAYIPKAKTPSVGAALNLDAAGWTWTENKTAQYRGDSFLDALLKAFDGLENILLHLDQINAAVTQRPISSKASSNKTAGSSLWASI